MKTIGDKINLSIGYILLGVGLLYDHTDLCGLACGIIIGGFIKVMFDKK